MHVYMSPSRVHRGLLFTILMVICFEKCKTAFTLCLDVSHRRLQLTCSCLNTNIKERKIFVLRTVLCSMQSIMIAYIPRTFHSVAVYYNRSTTMVQEYFIDAYCMYSQYVCISLVI